MGVNEKQFIPYEQALKLKELDLDEQCFGVYYRSDRVFLKNIVNEFLHENECKAPLWQQAFDFFREKYGLHYEIFLTNDAPYNKFHYRIMKIGQYFILSYNDFIGSYEEARLECLDKLIEFAENENN